MSSRESVNQLWWLAGHVNTWGQDGEPRGDVVMNACANGWPLS